MKTQFKPKNALLLMALAAAYPLQGHAAAGIAQFTTGDVTVRRGAGTDTLTKGKDIESGDAIVTGANGRAQIRFSDGGLVALQPNSQFNISKYADKNDAKEDSFLVDLLRGGMRSVTGLIGKRNRDNYKVTTQTATIGIRGSAFNLAYNPDGTLSVSTEQDEIEVCTQAGCVGLTAGESARVVSNTELAIRVNVRASAPVPPLRQDPEVAGNNTTSTGTAAIIPAGEKKPTATVYSGLAFASYGPKGESDKDHRFYEEGALTLDANGNPTAYLAKGTAADNVSGGTVTDVHTTGTLSGGDWLSIGVWNNGKWAGSQPGEITQFGFVTGVPTSAASIASLQGMRGEYSLVNATGVFSSTGVTGTLLDTSKLTVDFLGAGTYANVHLDISMPGGMETPSVATSTGTTLYTLRGSVTGTGAGFQGKLSVESDACGWGYSACGVGSIYGFFSGPDAAKLGAAYSAWSEAHQNFGGAATFMRGALGTGLPETTQSQMYGTWVGTHAGSTWTDTIGGYLYPYDGEYEFWGTHKFKGDQLVDFTDGSYDYLRKTGSAQGTFAAVGTPGSSDFLGWGYWVQGTTYSGSSVMLDGVHYVVGRPTPAYQMPVSGTYDYSLLGGTNPTSSSGAVGTLSGGSLTANFYNSSVSTTIDTVFSGVTHTISGYGYINGGASFNGCGNGNFQGFFSGAGAARAALTYDKDVGGELGKIHGAAVFFKGAAVSAP